MQKSKKPRIFICYAKEDREGAGEVYEMLELAGGGSRGSTNITSCQAMTGKERFKLQYRLQTPLLFVSANDSIR